MVWNSLDHNDHVLYDPKDGQPSRLIPADINSAVHERFALSLTSPDSCPIAYVDLPPHKANWQFNSQQPATSMLPDPIQATPGFGHAVYPIPQSQVYVHSSDNHHSLSFG